VEREPDLSAALAGRLTPDMTVSAGREAIGFVHRRVEGADAYFIANTSNQRQSFDATFRVTGDRAQRWDALTGGIAPIVVRRAGKGGGAVVALDLAPYESAVVVFRPDVTAWAGGTAPATGAAPAAPMDISAGWRVAFGPSGAPADWPTLRSWTDDEATRYFSGVAAYEKTVEVPAAMIRPGLALRLDLGAPTAIPVGQLRNGMQAWVDAPVRDAAVVYVNGTRAGTAWCPPYTVDVTALVRPGTNIIRIEAANTAINHMAGRALPDYRLLNLRYGARFEPQDMDKVQPVPAGLFGPIRLVAAPSARAATATR
jgi:hypothetical protein